MKILLVDDHQLLCNGVKQFLALRPGVEIVGQAATGASALKSVEKLSPDLIIMDIHLPDMSGIEVMQRVLERFPDMKILIFTGDGDRAVMDQALKAGVRGYVLKTSPVEELLQAVDAAATERLYICSELNTEILEDYRKGLNDRNSSEATVTEREALMLRLIAEGRRSKEIAGELDLTFKSVETYRSRLMKKLGCKSTAEMVRFAIREGIIAA